MQKEAVLKTASFIWLTAKIKRYNGCLKSWICRFE
jgi:hypothetical protein